MSKKERWRRRRTRKKNEGRWRSRRVAGPELSELRPGGGQQTEQVRDPILWAVMEHK